MKLTQTRLKALVIKILKILITGLMNLQVTRRVKREAWKIPLGSRKQVCSLDSFNKHLPGKLFTMHCLNIQVGLGFIGRNILSTFVLMVVSTELTLTWSLIWDGNEVRSVGIWETESKFGMGPWNTDLWLAEIDKVPCQNWSPWLAPLGRNMPYSCPD